MIKLAIFDWNGTLLADAKLRYTLNQDNIESMGHARISFSEYQRIFSIPVKNYYQKLGISDEIVAANAEKFNTEFHRKYDVATMRVRSRRGTRELLEYCKNQGIESVILSNHHLRSIREHLERLRLTHYFSAILANDTIHDAIHTGKKARIEQYLDGHHIQPHEAVIVGDTDEEVHIGKALGLKTIAITGGTHSEKRLRSEHPDLLVHSLREIIPVLEDKTWLQ